ncbi:MAG: hypothetical protein L0H44_06345, partial [Yaniella sp.]|nr:hypothetical protein [Yaniella sp.]MDN5888362.1 hypothetical protein [Yaniella sp.]
NQIKENTGWTHQTTPEHLSVITPTGHRYAKNTSPVLEGIPPDKQEPPEEEPRPKVRSSTPCFAKTTQRTLTLRLAA